MPSAFVARNKLRLVLSADASHASENLVTSSHYSQFGTRRLISFSSSDIKSKTCQGETSKKEKEKKVQFHVLVQASQSVSPVILRIWYLASEFQESGSMEGEVSMIS
jgi:hypothetical protein